MSVNEVRLEKGQKSLMKPFFAHILSINDSFHINVRIIKINLRSYRHIFISFFGERVQRPQKIRLPLKIYQKTCF